MAASKSPDLSISTLSCSNVRFPGAKRQLAEPEVIALNELLDTFATEMEESQGDIGETQKRKKVRVTESKKDATRFRGYFNKKKTETMKATADEKERESVEGAEGGGGEEEDDDQTNKTMKEMSLVTAQSILSTLSSPNDAKHMKLTDLEQHVRTLERDNLRLKRALLLGNDFRGENRTDKADRSRTVRVTSTVADIRRMSCLKPSRMDDTTERRLAERISVVTEMVEQLNAAYLSLGDASRVWHENCRISLGVREWDAFGRVETISLWNMIRSVFTSLVVDLVDLRPHVPDGEMILTKWRIQGEIATAEHLERVCGSEDCPATMRVALMAIKSSDLTFTVTTYVVFHDLLVAVQHHSWDHVGVFKRLFGGDIPQPIYKILTIDDETAAGRKPPLDV